MQAMPGGYVDPSCDYCCIHYPKRGIVYVWFPVGVLNLWGAWCAEM